ncbi:amino acid ABC transporter substrate-binding protein [Micromonospora sonchi]|uniref:Amino acid ABC transporter substrate-binding protein n=1 Tax=Micromonospora sonchi TaxID=1763543 RepID=A0A917TY08_9ACTN|nr:ABC transporter substrate-binding protein [Micromonospora sonchi]GGM42015.1 amino acid ABC transporter substrate-binding protein [Micromonospora sonchi]
MVSTSRILRLATAAGVLLAVGACSPQATPTPMPTVGAPCSKESLPTRTAGKLTIATDEPAYQPWFVDDKPDNGEGFESAVAYAVAEKLGYAREDVVWTRVRFDSAVAPGPKEFDFDINQFSITEERKQAVDFSAPYYLVRQTVIALKSSKIAGKTALADLRAAKLGAQVGTTSYQAITDVIKPTVEPQVYNSNDDAKKALQNGQLDGLVVDLPTAFYITGAEIDDAVIVGQLPQVGTPEAFGLLLDKDSPLTGCVSGAVGKLSADGALKQLEQQWLARDAGAPELT